MGKGGVQIVLFASDNIHTFDAGFFEPALDAGFFAAEVEGGLADAPREAGFDVPAAPALDAGFVGADFEAGFALDAGLAYSTKPISIHDTNNPWQTRRPASPADRRVGDRPTRTFFDGGFSASSPGPFTSSVVRFFPREDFGLGAADSPSSGSSSAAGATLAAAFLALGLDAAFLGGSGFGCSLIRLERRGSARVSVAAAAALRGISRAGMTGGKGGGNGLNWGRTRQAGLGFWFRRTLS